VATTTNSDVVKAFTEAVTHDDVESYLNLLSPDCEEIGRREQRPSVQKTSRTDFGSIFFASRRLGSAARGISQVSVDSRFSAAILP
jgi:hypothetical protein